MANNKKKNDGNFIQRNLNSFRNLTKLTTEEVYGTDENFHDENNRDLADIRNTINSITQQYKRNTGDDIIEFFNALSFNQNTSKSKKNVENETKKQLMDISNVIEHPEMFNITEIFSQEMSRIQLYNSYRLIYENIPQMTQALNTYVDNILSPDDFTKRIFNIAYKNVLLNATNVTVDNKEIVDNCEKLIDLYDLEDLSKKILTEALTIGDCFVSVLNIGKELERTILSEDGTLLQQDTHIKQLTMDDIVLSETEIIQLSSILDNKNINIPKRPNKEEHFKNANSSNVKSLTESFNELVDIYNEDTRIFNEESDKIKHDLAEMINSIQISEDYTCLFESNLEAQKEFLNEDKKTTLFNNYTDPRENTFNNANKRKITKRKKGKDEKITVKGSIIKILKPDRIVKLSLDNTEFGYYYIENLENSPDYLTTGSYSMTSNIFTNFKSQQTDKPDMMNAKYRLISDVFVRNLAKKIDKKFINTHPEFKNLIYNLLQQNYILNKQVRIVYLKPDEVIHFGHGTEEYKDSIYKPIHFSAKLYLAVLTSQVMLRLVRSPEKRAFYLEVDLDADTEAVVQSFIRDTKTKDIKMSNFGQDINTIMNSIGTFNDYFIPVVDGQKPVEIDTLNKYFIK